MLHNSVGRSSRNSKPSSPVAGVVIPSSAYSVGRLQLTPVFLFANKIGTVSLDDWRG